MEVITISIEQMGKNIAKATAKVIRCNRDFRYLFIPYLVDNSKDQNNSVKAKIIVQKKSAQEKWEDLNTLTLKQMQPDQWFNIDISSSELDTILNYCLELKKHYKEEGKRELFNSKRVMILAEGEKSQDAEDLINIMKEKPEVKEVVAQILSKNIDPYVLTEYISIEENKSKFLEKLSFEQANDIYTRLRQKITNVKIMKENINNSSEKFWQDFFTKNPNMLFSIIPSIFQIVCEQPYLGGKAIDNSGGKVSDYLYKFGTRNSCLIEIKTPVTDLVSNSYRDSYYPPSTELTGAIIQIRKQKDKFMKDYNTLKTESQEKGIHFDAYDPKCYVIIGNSDKLTPEQRADFELFRNSLKDIEVITFTELIQKLELLSQYI